MGSLAAFAAVVFAGILVYNKRSEGWWFLIAAFLMIMGIYHR